MHASNAELLRTVDLAVLGARLRAARLAKDWTQTDLAGEAISVGYVSRIESGTRRPNLRVLTDLASRLEIPVQQLLQGVTAQQYDEVRLGLDYAELALENGEAVDAERQAREQLAVAEAATLNDLADRARYLLARSLESLGDLDGAIDELETLVGSAAGPALISAGIALVRCYKETGDLALAIEVGERLEVRIRAAGLDQCDEGVLFAVNLAGAYIRRGDLHKAARICADAVRRADELSSPRARAGAYWNASLVHAQRGDVSTAAPMASRALALLTEGSDSRNLARLRALLGELQLQMDPPAIDDALMHLSRARAEMVSSSASEVDIAGADIRIAQSYVLAGDADRALETLAFVEESVGGRAPGARAEALVVRGQAYAALGSPDRAHRSYVEAMHVLTAAGADRSVAQLWFELADLLEDAGDLDGARQAYRSAAATSGLTPRRAVTRQVPTGL
ncbi:helix-turn-helix domain-containing protein [Nocardioides sp. MH1]|uniref:helix-turn-helix domain-containing protein n=1 Tax=Nocardioides sp. MH1 TaxID=3242490 RepID=UPI003520797C